MIGQTMINVKVPGARTRVSTFLAGVFLMVLCIVFGPVVPDIPMAVVVATSNLAIGVDGTITAMVIFAKRVAHLTSVTSVTDPDNTSVVYSVTGELFFASSNDLVGQFDTRRTRARSSSTCPPPTSGTPPPSRRSTPSRPNTPSAARVSRSPA